MRGQSGTGARERDVRARDEEREQGMRWELKSKGGGRGRGKRFGISELASCKEARGRQYHPFCPKI